MDHLPRLLEQLLLRYQIPRDCQGSLYLGERDHDSLVPRHHLEVLHESGSFTLDPWLRSYHCGLLQQPESVFGSLGAVPL